MFFEKSEEETIFRDNLKPDFVVEISENITENLETEKVSEIFKNRTFEVPVFDSSDGKIENKIRTVIGSPVSFLPKTEAVTAETDEKETAKETRGVEFVEAEIERRAEFRKIPLRQYLKEFCLPGVAEALGKFSEISTEDPLTFIADSLAGNF